MGARASQAVRPILSHPARTIGWCLVEARPQVLAIFCLRFAAGAALGWPSDGGRFPRTCVTALIWELAVFFVYLFNGVSDVHGDRLNGSTRPIARGVLDPGAALVVATAAAAVSMLGALAVGGPAAWLVPLLLTLGFLYSGPPFHFKRRSASTAAIGMAGGLLSYLAGATSPAGVMTPHAVTTLAVFAIGASAWMGLTGTLAKDLPDTAGDVAAGRNSAVVHLGDAGARAALSRVALTTAIAFNLTALTASQSLRACAVLMFMGAIVLAVMAHSPWSKGSRHKRRRPYRIFMLTQYATHICLLAPMLWLRV